MLGFYYLGREITKLGHIGVTKKGGGGNSISQIYEPESLFIMEDTFYFPFKKKKSFYPFPSCVFLPFQRCWETEGEKKPPKSYGGGGWIEGGLKVQEGKPICTRRSRCCCFHPPKKEEESTNIPFSHIRTGNGIISSQTFSRIYCTCEIDGWRGALLDRGAGRIRLRLLLFSSANCGIWRKRRGKRERKEDEDQLIWRLGIDPGTDSWSKTFAKY